MRSLGIKQNSQGRQFIKYLYHIIFEIIKYKYLKYIENVLFFVENKID